MLPPGSFDFRLPVALLTAHDSMMSLACCDTKFLSMLVAPLTGICSLLANDEDAVVITAGLLSEEGLIEVALGKCFATAEHSAALALAI